MGLYRTTNVGYFLHVKPQKIMQTTSKFMCTKCDKRMYDDFCKRCGTKIESVTVTTEATSDDIYDLIIGTALEDEWEDKWEDCFFHPESSVPGFVEINFDLGEKSVEVDEEAFIFSVEDLSPRKMSEYGEEKINMFLKEFKEIYGGDSIELKYGIYSYVS